MATVHDEAYRIAVQPFTIPQGGSARAQGWSFQTGTTRVESLVLPIHRLFPSQEAARPSVSRLRRLV